MDHSIQSKLSDDAYLGELLLAAQVIDANDLQSALALQQQYTSKIGELLVNQGACTEDDVLSALSDQLSLPRLAAWGSFPDGVEEIQLYGLDRKWWLTQSAYPLGERDGALWIAMPDVMDVFVADTLRNVAGMNVVSVIAGGHELRQLLSLLEVAGDHHAISIDDASLLQDLAAGAPIVQFVNDAIQRAMDEHASDIHFESYQGLFRVRFRVDGVLHEVDRPNLNMQPAIISRLKLMAGLDISEKRLPQDGRIRMRVGGLDLDIRVATSPGIAGESIVLRLLIAQSDRVSVAGLCMHDDHQKVAEELLANTNGVILVTGPTGSGKSTSLYAFLRELANDERKIITVEDPVEYQTQGITQIPVNAEIGLTFASILRSVLRQDPDIVLVGEIRDCETAEVAVQAALTGHLVLSTLHTNDAPSVFVRLMDMGVEPYMLASSVVGVVAQRLVRKVCVHCAVKDVEGEERARALGWGRGEAAWQSLVECSNFVKGVGCEKCLGYGYLGRRPIFEMFAVDDAVRHLLATKPDALLQHFNGNAFRTLRQDGLVFAAQGETTVEEVLRVTG